MLLIILKGNEKSTIPCIYGFGEDQIFSTNQNLFERYKQGRQDLAELLPATQAIKVLGSH